MESSLFVKLSSALLSASEFQDGVESQTLVVPQSDPAQESLTEVICSAHGIQ